MKIQNFKVGFLSFSSSFAFFCLLYNLSVMHDRFESYYLATFSFFKSFIFVFFEAASIYIVSALVLSLMFVFLHKLCIKIACSFFLLVCSVSSYFMVFMKVVITQDVMSAVVETSTSLSLELLNFDFAIWIFFTFVIPVSLLWLLLDIVKPKSLKKRFGFFALYFLLHAFCLYCIGVYCGFVAYNFNGRARKMSFSFTAESYTPSNVMHSTTVLINEYIPFKEKIENIKNLNDVYNYNFANKSNKKLKVVFLMGETARSDKFGINGYTRDTTPLLSKLQNQIITFKDVKSCRTVTTHSVLCLTTPHTFYNYDFIPEMGSFFDVFNSNDQNKTKHFKTHVYSMQTISWLYRIFKPDYVKTQYAMHNLNFASIFLDSDLLDDLDPILKLDTSDFIFLHTYGSHYNYILRYPKEFEKFKPICDKYPMSRCSKEQIVNAYDNTIFYTDYIISEVIRRLKDENAILFYVSDHGEKLGEHGSYLHGTRGGEKIYDYEVKVPMIMWASKKFLSDPENKKKFENAKKFVNVPISHDNIFHTVLGCSGFVSNNGGIDENLNLCSAKSAKDAKRKY